MLLSYCDPQFWKKFQAQHWLPRVPTVIRQPFKVFPFSEAFLLGALNSFEEGLRGGDLRAQCLVSVGDSERAPHPPLKKLFRNKSQSLAQLEEACDRVFPKKRFGLMVTNLQSIDPEIWSAITTFLQDAHQGMDFHAPRAFLDLFYGNYLSTFTGLHKDTQEIFAFVIRGEKRILAWPFDYFLSKMEGLSPGARYLHMRLPIDHRKYRKDAVVLDAQAGDVIYWPSDYWHVAEPRSEGSSAMLSLGLFRQDVVAPQPVQVPSGAHKLESAQQLRWLTGFGFEYGGPIVETPGGKRDEPLGTVTVVKKKNSLLLWAVNVASRRVCVATNGHSVTLPHSAGLVNLLERIAQGKPVSVSHSPNRMRGVGSLIFETNWNRQCELKTRKQVSKRDPGLSLVAWLLRVYAVDLIKI